MEKAHGSIIKALRAQKKQASQTSRDTSGPRYSLFLSFKSGMQTLIGYAYARSIRLYQVRCESRAYPANKRW